MPNRMAAIADPRRAPTPMLKPTSSANAAPVSDNSLDPCTATDIWRITINGPITPDTRASSAEASRACCTKSRLSRSAVTSKAKTFDNRWASFSLMGVPARAVGVVMVVVVLALFADDDVAAADLHHLDVGAVQLGEG